MLKTAGFTFLSKLLSAVFNLLLIIWISNLLGPEERGKCAFYLMVVVIILSIAEVAGGATTAYLMQKFSSEAITKWHGRWTLLPVTLVPIGFYFFNKVSSVEMVLLAIAGWFHCKWTLQQHIQLAFLNFKRFNFLVVLSPVITIIVFGLFWKFDFASSLSYLIALLISWAVLYYSGIFLSKDFRSYPSEERGIPTLRDIMAPGLLNQIAHLVSLINNRLIFFLFPAVQLGLWSNVLTLGESLLMIPGSLGQVLYAKLASKENGLDANIIFKKVALINGVIMASGIILLVLLPDSFWVLVFGEGFKGLKELLMVILPGIGFYSFYLLITYLQSAKGQFLLNLYPLIIGLAINLTGSFYLNYYKDYSLNAAIWVLNLSWVIISVLSALFFYTKNVPKSFSEGK